MKGEGQGVPAEEGRGLGRVRVCGSGRGRCQHHGGCTTEHGFCVCVGTRAWDCGMSNRVHGVAWDTCVAVARLWVLRGAAVVCARGMQEMVVDTVGRERASMYVEPRSSLVAVLSREGAQCKARTVARERRAQGQP